jgi:hypothetical protein
MTKRIEEVLLKRAKRGGVDGCVNITPPPPNKEIVEYFKQYPQKRLGLQIPTLTNE